MLTAVLTALTADRSRPREHLDQMGNCENGLSKSPVRLERPVGKQAESSGLITDEPLLSRP